MLPPLCLNNKAPVLFGHILSDLIYNRFLGLSCGLTASAEVIRKTLWPLQEHSFGQSFVCTALGFGTCNICHSEYSRALEGLFMMAS